MKCSKCSKKAIISLPYARLNLCSEHFVNFYHSRIKSANDKFKLIEKNDKIAIAVSGGKDSIALLNALPEIFKNEFCPIYIDLKIGEYSENSKKVFIKNCKNLGLTPKIVESKPIPEIAKKFNKVCSYCGLIKRYLLNKTAYELGCEKIATGHNLDDESSMTLKNFIDGNFSQLARLGPKLEKSEELKLVSKIKPLYLLSEKENLIYCEVRNLEYFHGVCPYSSSIPIFIYKKALNLVESKYPATKLNLINTFIKKLKPIIKEEKVNLKKCKICGFATTSEICKYCRLFGNGKG